MVVRVRGAVLAAVMVGCVGLAPVGAHGAAADLPPNHTMLYYNVGTGAAVTFPVSDGVIAGGSHQYQFSKNWSTIVISRDTALFYNIATGNASTGVMGPTGVYSGRHSFYLGKHWTHIAASCDSVLLYEDTTGEAVTGTLTGGSFTKVKDYGTAFSTGWTHVVSACGTAFFYNATTGRGVTGVLRAGLWTQKHDYGRSFSKDWQNVAATDDSVVFEKQVPADNSFCGGEDPCYTARYTAGKLYATAYTAGGTGTFGHCDDTDIECDWSHVGNADSVAWETSHGSTDQIAFNRLAGGVFGNPAPGVRRINVDTLLRLAGGR